MITQRPQCTGPVLDGLASMARLELSPARQAAVGPTVDMIYGLVDQLDALDLAETPAAITFDARWE